MPKIKARKKSEKKNIKKNTISQQEDSIGMNDENKLNLIYENNDSINLSSW